MKYSLSPCPRNAAATASDQPRLWVECAGDDTWPGALLSCGAAQPQARAGFLPGLAVTMPPRSPPACLTNIIILAASRFCAGAVRQTLARNQPPPAASRRRKFTAGLGAEPAGASECGGCCPEWLSDDNWKQTLNNHKTIKNNISAYIIIRFIHLIFCYPRKVQRWLQAKKGRLLKFRQDSFQHKSMSEGKSSFWDFYRQHFLPEHQHPINQGLHVVGTIGSTVFAAAALISSRPWLALLYPIVFTVPGLLGHRIFERNMDVGDMRITRKDFPPHWFIIGNYLLSYELLLGKGCERTSKAD